MIDTLSKIYTHLTEPLLLELPNHKGTHQTICENIMSYNVYSSPPPNSYQNFIFSRLNLHNTINILHHSKIKKAIKVLIKFSSLDNSTLSFLTSWS